MDRYIINVYKAVRISARNTDDADIYFEIAGFAL